MFSHVPMEFESAAGSIQPGNLTNVSAAMKARRTVILSVVFFSGFGYSDMCTNDIRYSTMCNWCVSQWNPNSYPVMSPSLIPNG